MPGADAELRAAVLHACEKPGVIRTHFQPIVDLARGVATGYEALSRFAGPPQATPDRWFAAAHELGVGEELELRALASALDARDALPLNCFLTVNVGPRALLSPGIRELLRRSGDLRGVVVELTEQQQVDDYDELKAALAPLRDAGALLAVDDAGAGFSSLQHIVSLRPDLVKVDRALVAGIDEDETKAAVIETLGIFASRLDAWLLAEGVETHRELERLISLRVPLAQGYGLGRPAPAMGGIDAGAAQVCRRRAEMASRGGLADLAEAAAVATVGASDAEIADALLAHPGCSFVTLVDEFARPVGLAPRAGIRPRAALPALCVTPGERVTDVVRRVVSRPAAERLLPVALCDDQGRLLGLVPVERLLERLADEVDTGAEAGAAPEPQRHAA